MPRQKRAERLKGIKPIEAPRAYQEPTWNITEVTRVRCPHCGMLPEAHRIEEGPYEVEVKIQRFGGRGNMQYVSAPDQEEHWRKIIIKKMKLALKQLEGK